MPCQFVEASYTTGHCGQFQNQTIETRLFLLKLALLAEDNLTKLASFSCGADTIITHNMDPQCSEYLRNLFTHYTAETMKGFTETEANIYLQVRNITNSHLIKSKYLVGPTDYYYCFTDMII